MAVAVLGLDRFTIGPAETGEALTRHAALAAAVKDAFPGVIEVQLTKAGDQMWIGVWRWDSFASDGRRSDNAAPATATTTPSV
jgi:hypothetical protein